MGESSHFSNHNALISQGFVDPGDRSDIPLGETARLAQKLYST